jgi:exopolyphosphatase / guanosine-5'-triphosphate,3'-diphosphate pyrophosphatase
MKDKIAIIDLGTNTCNLLVANYGSNSFQILYQGKEVVKLAKNGDDKNMLATDGLDRATTAIQKHQKRIEEYGVPEIIMLATSAIREASNREWFKTELEQRTGIQLSVISGDREAELIFKGVCLAMGQVNDQSIILDIGGGSNEMILTKNGQPLWKQSFPIGMARVINQYPPSNPINKNEVKQIISYFDAHLTELWNITDDLNINDLIGCSGAFDTLADLIDQTEPGSKSRIRQEIKISDFDRIYQLLINSKTEEREKMKGMESIRVEMIVPSVILIKLIIDRLKIKTIIQTDFALREGVLYEYILS